MPSLQIILIGVDFFSFHCLSYFIHIFHFSPDLYLSLFLYNGYGISPRGWNLPKLFYFKFTLIRLPLLAVIIIFLFFIYIDFDMWISSKALSISKFIIEYIFVPPLLCSRRISPPIQYRLEATFFRFAKSNRLSFIYSSKIQFALIISIGSFYRFRRRTFSHFNSSWQIDNGDDDRRACFLFLLVPGG